MLLFNEILNNLPVASVQATHQIGLIIAPIVDPRDLSIPALRVQPSGQGGERVLFTSDIRSMSNAGLIIDHDEQLMENEDLVRLNEVTRLAFEPLGKRVETEDGQKLGTVSRFAFTTDNWKILKLHLNPTVTKSLTSSGLIINRPQIVKVTDSRIIVKSTAIKSQGFSLRKLFFGSTKPALKPEAVEIKK